MAKKDSVRNDYRNYVLGSFNIFDPKLQMDVMKLVGNPGRIKTNKGIMGSSFNPQTDIVLNNNGTTYQYTAKRVNSSSEISSAVSESLQISGSYGIFSGSASIGSTESSVTKETSYMGFSTGVANCGTANYNGALKLDMLNTDLQNQLTSIKDMKTARDFVKEYGTHIITGLRMGGMFSYLVTAESTSQETDSEITASLEAGIDTGFTSADAKADFTQRLKKSYASNNVKVKLTTIGGNVMYYDSPKSDDPSYQKWVDSIKEVWFAVSSSLAFHELDDTKTKTWSTILKKYMDASYLCQSLKNPFIFLAQTQQVNYNFTSIQVLNLLKDKGVKIVSGGARMADDDTTFLSACYPVLDEDKTTPIGWVAECHAFGSPCNVNNKLYAYCMAIYDPGDLLAITTGQSFRNGTYNMPDDTDICTGGGFNHDSNVIDYALSSCKLTILGGYGWTSWVCLTDTDIKRAAAVVYSIFVTITDKAYVNQSAILSLGSNFSSISTSNNNLPYTFPSLKGSFIGAGIHGPGSCIKASYPIDNKNWYGSWGPHDPSNLDPVECVFIYLTGKVKV